MPTPIAAFRAKLDAGIPCIGPGITFTDPLVTDALASSVDFFWIDLEHSGMSTETLGRHLLATRARGVPALVRVPGSAVALIKPVLDIGADGIIVPQVRSADEVRAIVDACRYPPSGHRGWGPRVPTNYGRDPQPEYLERASRLFVAVQIETLEAMAELEAIAAIPGLDSLALGPWDLSGAHGHLGDVEHPVVVAAIERTIAAARAAGKYIGTGMGPDPAYAATMARRGCQWLQVGDDCGYLIQAADRLRRDIHGLLG